MGVVMTLSAGAATRGQTLPLDMPEGRSLHTGRAALPPQILCCAQKGRSLLTGRPTPPPQIPSALCGPSRKDRMVVRQAHYERRGQAAVVA